MIYSTVQYSAIEVQEKTALSSLHEKYINERIRRHFRSFFSNIIAVIGDQKEVRQRYVKYHPKLFSVYIT